MSDYRMAGPAEDGSSGEACKKALAPHVERLRIMAIQAGWTPAEVGIGLLALGADQLKELGYGEMIH